MLQLVEMLRVSSVEAEVSNADQDLTLLQCTVNGTRLAVLRGEIRNELVPFGRQGPCAWDGGKGYAGRSAPRTCSFLKCCSK